MQSAERHFDTSSVDPLSILAVIVLLESKKKKKRIFNPVLKFHNFVILSVSNKDSMH